MRPIGGNEPTIITQLDFPLDGAAQQLNLSRDDLVAVMLKERTDGDSVADVLHI